MKITKNYLKTVIKEELQKEIFGNLFKKAKQADTPAPAPKQQPAEYMPKLPSNEEIQRQLQLNYKGVADVRLLDTPTIDKKSIKHDYDYQNDIPSATFNVNISYAIGNKEVNKTIIGTTSPYGVKLEYPKPDVSAFKKINQTITSPKTQGAQDKIARDKGNEEEYYRSQIYGHPYKPEK